MSKLNNYTEVKVRVKVYIITTGRLVIIIIAHGQKIDSKSPRTMEFTSHYEY